MSGLDLNAPPAKDVDLTDIEPLFCTQPAPAEIVGESPDPGFHEHGAVGGESGEQSGRGPQHNATQTPRAANRSMPTTTAPTDTTADPEFAEGAAEEVASSPQEPFVGMRFDTIASARAHYNAYAAKIGFSIKNHTSKRERFTNELEKQQFVCNKHRKPKTEEEEQKERITVVEDVSPVQLDDGNVEGENSGQSKKKSSSRFGVKRKRESIKQTQCPARLFVKFIDNKWQVTYFVAEHNHPLLERPSLTKYLRSHRGIPRDEKEFLKCLHNCNLETGRMMEVMSEFYGEDAFVPYGPKTISNLRSEFRSENKEYDIGETLEHFKELQRQDPTFFYKISFDSENRVENIFWVDGGARKAYVEAYHDCVSFDTTFMTNRFNMPFAPFIGINRHGQSFMLGCGFLRDEKEESFKWLFRTFLEAMHGKQPANIITDQDWAMRAAIAAVFPESYHRNCRWHIMKKANEKLGSFLGRRPGLAEEFNECVDESMTPEEFEANWGDMVHKWELSDNETFAWLKKYAHTWVPCYFRTRFFPFLQSTQRSEGFNAVLKRCINPQNSIKHFVRQYEKIQAKILGKEGCNDYRTDELQVKTWSPFPIEKHALSVYTRDIYLRFRLEFELIGRYNVQLVGPNLYTLVPNNLSCYPYGSRTYMVNANGGNDNFSCECCKFERDGLLCCHVLKVFTHIGVDAIPERYIMKRWTQQAVQPVDLPSGPMQDDVMPEESRKKVRFANLSRSFVQLAKVLSESDQAEAIARRHIREMNTEFAQLNKVRKKKKSRSANMDANTAQQAAAPNLHRPTKSAPNVQQAPTSGRAPTRAPPESPPPPPPPPFTYEDAPWASTTASTAGPHLGSSSGAAHLSPQQPSTSAHRAAPAQPPPANTAHSNATVARTTNRARKSSSGAGGSSSMRQGCVVAPNLQDFVILNPPRSTTKGRKKGRIPSGIELQAKKMTLCGVCGEPGHNSATCSSALGPK